MSRRRTARGVLTWRQALELARRVFAVAVPIDALRRRSGRNFLGYALWNETAWPFARDESTLRRQLEEYRDRPIERTKRLLP